MFKRALSRAFSARITLLAGDGIGPEVARSVSEVFDAAQAPITWVPVEVTNPNPKDPTDWVNPAALEMCKETTVGLKGPTATPIGAGNVSINVTLRRELDLFANVRPCKSLPGIKTRYDDVDLVTIRENTEGEYSGKEHEVVPGVIENLKIISERACNRISKYAFDFVQNFGRSRVHALHKASVMKMGDGLFLKCAREMSTNYPGIPYEEKNVDTACGILVSNPSFFDVMVMPNLYGDIVSDICAGLIGGLGLTPSGNIGENYAVFEAVHGSAPDIAGLNKANPTALLLSSVMMLRHLNLYEHADKIERAIHQVLREGTTLTGDLGGSSSTTQFTQAIIQNL